jgi:hypothetical protein
MAFAQGNAHRDLRADLAPEMGSTQFVRWTITGCAGRPSWRDAMNRVGERRRLLFDPAERRLTADALASMRRTKTGRRPPMASLVITDPVVWDTTERATRAHPLGRPRVLQTKRTTPAR